MNKRWFLGCSGCLGAVILIIIGLSLLGWWGVNSFMTQSSQMGESFFGGQLPPNYSAWFGLSMQNNGEQSQTVILMDTQHQRMLAGIETTIAPSEIKRLRELSTSLVQKHAKGEHPKDNARGIMATFKQKMEVWIQDALKSSGVSNESELKSFQLMNLHGVQVKQTPCLIAEIMSQRQTNTNQNTAAQKPQPMVFAAIPLTETRLKILILFPLQSPATNAEESQTDLPEMVDHLKTVLLNTSVTKQVKTLPSFQSGVQTGQPPQPKTVTPAPNQKLYAI